MMSNESYIFLAVLTALALVALIYLLSPMSLPDEPLLYLIGVNHAVQFKSALSQVFSESESVRAKREAFKAHVAEMIDKLGIEVLAEEFSEESKRKPPERETALNDQSERAWFETALALCNYETVLEQFSKAKGIEHRFCDPDSKERKALGIEESDWGKREQRGLLFVCGDNHYDAFAQLLENDGFSVRHGAHYDISDEEFHDLAGNVIETHEHTGEFKEP